MENNIAHIHEAVYAYLTEDLKDQNLRFTLRVKNRADRISQGYWFTGNDNYLTFSFWQGLDWRNKTPNIYFAININGTSSLDFVCYDDETKIKFFSEVAEALGMRQMEKSRTGEKFEHWVKNYKGTDYIASLDTFLKQDKKIIDAFIKSNDTMKDLFKPIDNDDFINAQKRIDIERKKFKKHIEYKSTYKKVKSIFIKDLRFENISVFNETQYISFHKNLTCIIGLNGTGKTSILRALVLAFTGYNQNESIGLNDPIITARLQNLMRISGVNDKNNREYPKEGGFVEIHYAIENFEEERTDELFRNKVLITINGQEPEFSDDTDSDFRNVRDDKYNCLFLAFPQLQGESNPNVNTNTSNEDYPHLGDAISMLNNKPDNRFDKFANWLRNLENKANAKQVKDGTIPQERILLRTIFEVMSDVTGEQITLNRIASGENGEPIWVNIGANNSPILFELVSQGFNNVFGWIGYFMKRLVDITPNNEDFTQTSGIVLIDEIDTYLHPKWQSSILNVLIEKFPNIQFVVTTHSPYVAGSVPNEKIKIYICEENKMDVSIEEFTEFTPYGADLERLSTRLFKTPDRVKIIGETIEAIDKLIGSRGVEAVKKETDLISKIGTLPNFMSYASISTDPLDIAQKAIEELKKITSNDDAELLSLEAFVMTKKRLNQRQNASHS
jgi:predicted ATP-binding protein involved in virulence